MKKDKTGRSRRRGAQKFIHEVAIANARHLLDARWCKQNGHSPVIEQRLPSDASVIEANGLDVQTLAERLVCERCGAALMAPSALNLQDRLARILTVAGGCESFTASSAMRCFHKYSGKHFNARYGADDYCLPCKVHVLAHGNDVSWELFVS